MTDYEYAQAVMKAAGVEPRCALCACGHEKATHGPNGVCLAIHADYSGCSDFVEARKLYPDPLTSGDAFLALWDALVTKDFLVRATAWNTSAGKKSTFICIEGKNKTAYSDNEDIKAALVEAAGLALGVSR